MRTNQYIIDYYNSHDEDSQLNPKHRIVEFLTIMRYMKKYIKPRSCVLEIGVGAGHYFHVLARQGYMVDAVGLVPHNIEVFRRYMLPTEHIAIIQGSALDLSAFPDNRHDIMLLLGSLCHLYSKEEKRQALDEAIRVAKQGGITFAVYAIFDGCLLDEGSNHGNINATEYIKNGLPNPETLAAKSEPKGLFEFVHKEDIDDLMLISPTTRPYYTVADGCALLIREAIDKMNDETPKLHLKYHYATRERKDLTGITSHAIDISQK